MTTWIMRTIQCATWLAAALAFDVLRRSDPIPPTTQEWFLGVLVCGFGAMYAVTFLITLVRFGPKAARSMKWY